MKYLIPSLIVLVLLGSCDTDEPEAEHVEEIITKVTVTFTPTGGGTPVVVSAIDPDGDGPQNLEAEGMINLEKNLPYELTLKFENTLENPAEDITEEIEEEADEHMIFFGWTGGVFDNPSNGNISNNRNDVRYEDEDDDGYPVGLVSTWTTADAEETGTFRLVLKHQPDGIKTADSGVTDGSSDVDVTFDIEVGK